MKWKRRSKPNGNRSKKKTERGSKGGEELKEGDTWEWE